MWCRTLVVTVMVALAANAIGQELVLNQIDNIILPETLITINAQDLNHDGQSEIVVTTAHYVLVYHGSGGTDYLLLWTSPALARPAGLILSDINNDSLTDIAVSDSSHIYLFDPYHSNTIWTSPQLDSTFSCFTFGDINNDTNGDVVIVRNEYFSRRNDSQNLDTVWVDIYDGPSFIQRSGPVILVRYYEYSEGNIYRQYYETPSKVIVAPLTGTGGTLNRLVLFTSNSSYYRHYSPWQELTTSGGYLRIFDPISFDYEFYNIGVLRLYNIEVVNSQNQLEVIAYFSSYDGAHPPQEDNYYYKHNADTVALSMRIWRGSAQEWTGYIIDDISEATVGSEIYFSEDDFVHSLDRLHKFSISQGILIWNIQLVRNTVVQYSYHDPRLLTSTQVVCFNTVSRHYHFYNAENGLLSATISTQAIGIKAIADLNRDSTDEILATSGLSLGIYEGVSITGIEGDGELPRKISSLSIYPNPFNGVVTIEYNLARSSPVEIEIYDIAGRRVGKISEPAREPGTYRATWDARNLNSGLFFCRVQAGGEAGVRKMVYLK